MPTIDPQLYVPIAPDPVNDPGNWREIDRLRRLADAEGRTFDPNDPYNWRGIAAAQAAAATTTSPGTAGTTPAATTPAAGVTAPAATPGTATSVNERNRALFSTIASIIQASGLQGLFGVASDGTPTGPLWDQITNGLDSEAALIAWFESTPQFQARFPAIAQARASGVGVIPTPVDVRNYEEDASVLLRRAGLPQWFYDDPVNDLQSLMAQNISLVELQDRLGQAWTTVRETDPAVLDAFSQFFGVEGEAAMAAFFLDPQRTQAALDRAARTAYTAGMGATVGLDIDQQLADRIASLPSTYAGIWEDLTSISQLDAEGGVFTEGITETQDLTASGTGVDAVIFGDGDAAAQMERRILRRQANSRSSLGGAAVTERGAVGVS